jgi:hypothetical protein
VDLSVQYTLREPFFISTRLMPAVRVGAATIHMRAHSVDADDGDTVVRWEYLIDAPSVHYGANDVSTFYVAEAAIAQQLPTVMGGLLAALSHVADGDEAGPFPHEVYQWAHRHQDEITMVLDGIDNPEPQVMASSGLWRAITHDLYQTPYGRWCAAQAIAHADQLATLNPPAADTANTGLAVRDEAWHDSALGWYTMLTNQSEPEQAPIPVCAVADRATIQAWLRQPAPQPNTGTLGHVLGLDDRDHQWHGSRTLQMLIEQAQRDGLFGIRNHTIRVHTVLDHLTGADASLLTVHAPSGATLAAGPIATDILTAGMTGRGDEVTALRNCATAVASAFAAQQTAAAPGRSRPFPPLGIDPTAAATVSTAPGSPATTAHRHR